MNFYPNFDPNSNPNFDPNYYPNFDPLVSLDSYKRAADSLCG
jgi:hypothetical protein